jgi:hypothetical protein
VAVLATSREVLRIEGEFVYRIPAIEVPDEDQEQSLALLVHSAMQLATGQHIVHAKVPRLNGSCRDKCFEARLAEPTVHMNDLAGYVARVP